MCQQQLLLNLGWYANQAGRIVIASPDVIGASARVQPEGVAISSFLYEIASPSFTCEGLLAMTFQLLLQLRLS